MSHFDCDGDRITNLHETVLSHILSRLTTRDAVRTSILCKDWEYKWTSVYNVNITDRSFRNCDAKKELFQNFVYRILHFSRHLKSFRLVCKDIWDPTDVQKWISTALKHNLESFEVDCVVTVVFPCNLLNSTSLRKLRLHHRNTLTIAAKTCAPFLTSLHLDTVHIMNGDPDITTVTFTFPVLETFTVQYCKWLNVKLVQIYAPSLTTFTSEAQNCDVEYEYSLEIIAPRLATFENSCGLPEKIIMNGSSIVSAFLTSHWYREDVPVSLLLDIGLRTRKLLNLFTSLEELELSSSVAEACQLGPPLRCFHKLRRLVCGPSNPEQLFELVHAMPTLKFLTFDLCKWDDYICEAMKKVPSCFVSHLEEVTLSGFIDEEPRPLNFVKYLFENGAKLKKLHVIRLCERDVRKQNEVKEYFSALPRRSPCLTIEVSHRW